MKAIFPADALRNALARVGRVVPSKTPKPILTCIRLECTEDPDRPATMDATDLEVGVRVAVGVHRVERPGVAVIEARRLGTVLARAGDALVTIDVTDPDDLPAKGKKTAPGGLISAAPTSYPAQAAISHEHTIKARVCLAAEDPALYPVLAFGDDAAPRLFTPAGELAAAVARCGFAVDEASTRYALAGGKLEAAPAVLGGGADRAVLVCTDGRRLAVQAFPAACDAGAELPGRADGVVPIAALRLAAQLCGGAGADEPARWRFLHRRGPDGPVPHAWALDVADARVYARLVEGRFPAWAEALPAGEPRAVLADDGPGALARLAEQAAVATDKEQRAVRLELHAGRALAWARTADVGSARAWLDAPPGFAGDPGWSSLAADFLKQALGALAPAEPYRLEWRGEAQAVVLRGVDYLHVLMPLTIEPGDEPAEDAVRAARAGEVAA